MPFAPNTLLCVKEVNGRLFVAQVTKATSDVQPGTIYLGNLAGNVNGWYYIGDGNSPSIQEYSDSQFIVTFSYLSHLVTRVLDLNTWPPNLVVPITTGSSGGQTFFAVAPSANMPEDAVILAVNSSNGDGTASHYFNPVQLTPASLVSDPINGTFSVTIALLSSWHAENGSGLFTYYRVYRRPLAGGPWTLVQDWSQGSLSFTDTVTTSIFQYQYTATWGTSFSPLNPNNPSLHDEGIIGDGEIMSFDSTTQALTFALTPDDFMIVAPAEYQDSTNATMHAEERQAFYDEQFSDEISLSNALVEASTLAVPAVFDTTFPAFYAEEASDEISLTTSEFQRSTLSAPAFLGT
jgi:hypothetical protein